MAYNLCKGSHYQWQWGLAYIYIYLMKKTANEFVTDSFTSDSLLGAEDECQKFRVINMREEHLEFKQKVAIHWKKVQDDFNYTVCTEREFLKTCKGWKKNQQYVNNVHEEFMYENVRTIMSKKQD